MKLHQLAQETLDEVGRALLPPAPDGDPNQTAALCRAAVIGFAGNNVRGTLGVGTSWNGLARVLAHSGAMEESGTSERTRAEDSLAELSNLLLGAIKRAWLRRDLQITLAIPLVIRGRFIEICAGEDNCWFTTESSLGDDRVTVWMDIHCDADLEVPAEDLRPDRVSEGEPLLF